MREPKRTRGSKETLPVLPETQGTSLEPCAPEDPMAVVPTDEEAEAWDLFVTSIEEQTAPLPPIDAPSFISEVSPQSFLTQPETPTASIGPEQVSQPVRKSTPVVQLAHLVTAVPDRSPAAPNAAMSDNRPSERKQLMTTAQESPSVAQRDPKSGDMSESEEKAQLRDYQAMDIIHKHVLGVMGAGLVPIPVVDVAAMTAIQMKMIRDLANYYRIDFAKNQVTYSLIGSVTAGIGAPMAITPLLSSMMKLVPGFGTAAGVASLPIVGGASTYALGKVFAGHFEAGGTLFTFDPAKVRERMKSYYTEGLKKAEELKNKPASAPAA